MPSWLRQKQQVPRDVTGFEQSTGLKLTMPIPDPEIVDTLRSLPLPQRVIKVWGKKENDEKPYHQSTGEVETREPDN